MKIRSRVLHPPEIEGRVPKFTFWASWWVSHKLISWVSIRDSGELPLGRMPEPSLHVAFGKLKSPARIISGTGQPRFPMQLFILLIIMFLNDCSR